jgi:hypothetical protein
MESFFNTIFLVFVIAFVGVRIISMLRRRNNDRQRQESAAPKTAPQESARGFVPWEDEFRDNAGNAAIAGNAGEGGPAQTAPEDDDDGFSAWNLSVDDTPSAPVDPPAPKRLPEAPRPDPDGSARRPVPGRSLERRFRSLPPLQQAVVWAEILGTPKGLQGERLVNPK